MTWVFVEQQRHVPAKVVFVNQSKKRLKVSLFLLIADEEHSFACLTIHGPEDDSASVPAGDLYFGWYSSLTPRSPKRWNQKQVRLILSKRHGTRR